MAKASNSTSDPLSQIFMVFDSDGSGELDKDEFVKALGHAGGNRQIQLSGIHRDVSVILCSDPGFNEAEADDIFDQVNTDGGDGVGIEEFEAW